MLSLIALSLMLAAPQVQPDPEQTKEGRTHFLGRRIAQTMHWTGASWLMRKTREEEENGALLRQWLAVQPGQAICDLGCGNGYHTLPLASAVGEAGTIYAVDLQPQMLVLLRQRSNKQKLNNLTFVEATLDDPKLPASSCDLVLMVDVYHELSHPVRVMSRVRNALRPGGRVVLVEFRTEDPDVPIKPEHMMSKAQVIREMAVHGFALADECDDLPWQHAMAFERAKLRTRLAPEEVLRAFLKARAGDDARIVQPFLVAGLQTNALPILPQDARFELRQGPGNRLLAKLRAADGSQLEDTRTELVLKRDRDARWRIEAAREPKAILRSHGSNRVFAAMHTALGRDDIDKRIALAQELDYDGVAWSLDDIAATREACESRGIDLISAYAVLRLNDKNTASRIAKVIAAIDTLANGPGQIWLALQHATLKPADIAGDETAIATLQQILTHANRTGVEVALYPHTGFWLETTEQALRLCNSINHQQLGVCFNLCHFLRNHQNSDPSELLARCGKKLAAVTINGADLAGDNWATLIQPLGTGDFDLRELLATLDTIAFEGPTALQGYGIRMPARELLSTSMTAWRAAQR